MRARKASRVNASPTRSGSSRAVASGTWLPRKTINPARFREHLPRYYITCLAAPSVMRWVRYRGWRLEEECEEGDRVRIRLRFDAEEEGLQFALSFGADVEVIEPAELRNKVLEAARGTIGRYT